MIKQAHLFWFRYHRPFIKQNMKAVFIVMQLQKCPEVFNLYLISVLLYELYR